MAESTMHSLLVLLALLGGVALVVRALGAVLRLALRAAEETAASGLADVSARRGDLTGMAERRQQLAAARARRRRELRTLALWLTWLAVPPVLGWLPAGYAPAALLWLVHRRRSDPTARPPAPS